MNEPVSHKLWNLFRKSLYFAIKFLYNDGSYFGAIDELQKLGQGRLSNLGKIDRRGLCTIELDKLL